MEKKISVAGRNGTFSGSVVVLLNQVQDFTYNNPSSHDSEPGRRYVTKIREYVPGKEVKEKILIGNDENDLEKQLQESEQTVTAFLKELANKKTETVLIDKLKTLGYE